MLRERASPAAARAACGLHCPTCSHDTVLRVQLAIANAIWASNGLELASDFIRQIEHYHRGEVANVDFAGPAAADTINRWVAGKTNRKIRELVTSDLVRSAILILVNANCFKGIWTFQFDEERTEERPFTLPDGSRTLCPMMDGAVGTL